jgi:hypothetical protein
LLVVEAVALVEVVEVVQEVIVHQDLGQVLYEVQF